jgi:preprotein translocase subunit SecA
VEARNFDIRKTLIKFDNVLNDQRHVVFAQRKNAMNSNNIFDYSDEFLKEIIQDIVKLKIQKLANPKNSEFHNRLKKVVGKNFNESEFEKLIFVNDKELEKKINLKFIDSRNERIKILGENHAKEIEKRIFLQSIDLNWKSHIQYLEQLRQVIGLRSYGQRDPLIEYKKEAFDLFSNLLEKLKLDYVTILMNLKIVTEMSQKDEKDKITPINPNLKNKKIGRNEPCFCNSGKKFKHCHGAL